MKALSSREFYDSQYAKGYVNGGADPAALEILERFVFQFRLSGALVLELGCGRGAYRNLASRWIGADLSIVAAREAGGRALVCRASVLPFPDASFDAIWSVQTLEHVAEPEECLLEFARVLRPGGLACIAPAWHCRPWTRDGVEVRRWNDLDWKLRFLKATRPFRELRLIRAVRTLTARVAREIFSLARPRTPARFRFVRLRPNYERFWQPDSDAASGLDQHELIEWFRSRGWHVFETETIWRRLSYNLPAVIVRSPARESEAGGSGGAK